MSPQERKRDITEKIQLEARLSTPFTPFPKEEVGGYLDEISQSEFPTDPFAQLASSIYFPEIDQRINVSLHPLYEDLDLGLIVYSTFRPVGHVVLELLMRPEGLVIIKQPQCLHVFAPSKTDRLMYCTINIPSLSFEVADQLESVDDYAGLDQEFPEISSLLLPGEEEVLADIELTVTSG